MRNVFLIILIMFLAGCDANNMISELKGQETPRFEVHQTQNIFNLLLLDTKTGGLWQVQYTLDEKSQEGDIQLSEGVVYETNSWNGRFTLTSTKNMWTYLLTDTKSGAMWHCQFTVGKKGYRGCYPMVAPKA